MTTIRQQVARREDQQIAANVAQIEASRKPRTALEAMAQRLEMSPGNLKNTLMATVFKECRNDSEFAALIVVANEYGLNPLLKEIYAFPAKGGGVVPMVGVDGWIRLMNNHPQFDGIEFEYTNDEKGNTVAIEAIISRRDRTKPIKVMEYMDECKGNTGPWQKSPRRMLRHRALIQGARIAFGFNGIAAEGDEEAIEGNYTEVQALPSRQSIEEELDDGIPAFDRDTGEIVTHERHPDQVAAKHPVGMTEVDEATARELDAQSGQPEVVDEAPPWAKYASDLKAQIAAAKTKAALQKADDQFLRISGGLPDDVAAELDGLLRAKRSEISEGGQG